MIQRKWEGVISARTDGPSGTGSTVMGIMVAAATRRRPGDASQMAERQKARPDSVSLPFAPRHPGSLSCSRSEMSASST